MSQILFSNNASSTLAGAINAASTSLNLAAGTGSLFPSPGANQYFIATLTDAATGLVKEIVYVLGIAGDSATIERGQEGTVPLAWNAGDIFENRLTAGTMRALDQTAISHGRLLGTQGFDTPGDYALTMPAGTYTIEMDLQAAGGSGGSCDAQDGAHSATGTGGNGGNFLKCMLPAALAVGKTLHMPAGGVSPGFGALNGNPGGALTFGGTFIVVPGGLGGQAGVSQAGAHVIGNGTSAANTIGVGVTILETVIGAIPDLSVSLSPSVCWSGAGGRSHYGQGGPPVGVGNGNQGLHAGTGGSGAVTPANGGVTAGGAGYPTGLAIIRYYG